MKKIIIFLLLFFTPTLSFASNDKTKAEFYVRMETGNFRNVNIYDIIFESIDNEKDFINKKFNKDGLIINISKITGKDFNSYVFVTIENSDTKIVGKNKIVFKITSHDIETVFKEINIINSIKI